MPDRTRPGRVSLLCESDSLRSKRQSRQAQVKECASVCANQKHCMLMCLKLARDGGEMTDLCAELLMGVCPPACSLIKKHRSRCGLADWPTVTVREVDPLVELV